MFPWKNKQPPADAVSPLASYECGNCGMGLIAAGTKLVYLVVVVLAIALLVFAALFVEERVRAGIKFGWLAIVVLGYSIRQLTRKSIRRTDDESYSNP